MTEMSQGAVAAGGEATPLRDDDFTSTEQVVPRSRSRRLRLVVAGGAVTSPLLYGTSGLAAPSRDAPDVAFLGDWTSYSGSLVTVSETVLALDGLGSSADELLALRALTRLTWAQIARLLGVDRRTLHLWANGRPLRSRNAEKLTAVLVWVRALSDELDGDPARVRNVLLASLADSLPLDRLATLGVSSDDPAEQPVSSDQGGPDVVEHRPMEHPSDRLDALHDEGDRLGPLLDAEVIEPTER